MSSANLRTGMSGLREYIVLPRDVSSQVDTCDHAIVALAVGLRTLCYVQSSS